MSAVYRGQDRVSRREVVVKVQRATGDSVAVERFRREAAVMERLRHPNLVTLYSFVDGDPAALVMEYVPGRTLAQQVDTDGWLAPARAARIIEEVAAALDSAHAAGVIHRDIKPSNILLPPHGAARLTDFGVAHINAVDGGLGADVPPLTVMGDILGTIEYASPEQVHGHAAPDARSDVYSLAAVAYFALCGTPPFRAADASTQAQLSVMHRQVFAEPPPLRFHHEDLSPEVEQVVLRGLAKAPAARYPSAGQFAASLRAATGDWVPVPAFATERRRGAIAGAVAVPVVLALAALGYWLTSGHSPARQSLPAPDRQASRPAVPAPIKTVPAPVKTAPQSIVAAKPAPKAVAQAVPKAVAQAVPKAVAQAVPKAVAQAVPKPASHPHPARPKSAPLVAAAPPAKRPRPLPPRRVAKAGGPPPRPASHQGWLRVVADQNILRLTMTASGSRGVSVPPQSIWVDGRRVSGVWTALPPGRHTVSFVPKPGSGFAPAKGMVVTLRPGQYATTHIILPPAPRLAAAPPAPNVPQKAGWYTVSGWTAAPVPARAAALWVKVDGVPFPALAQGQWAELPAGRHEVIFQPVAGQGVLAKTWQIDLGALAHLDQKIPLPAAPLPEIPPHLRNPTTQQETP